MLAPVLAALALAVVHLLAGAITRGLGRVRSHWLSFAGGVSVAYVFVRLIPELAAARQEVAREFWVEEAIFAVGLAGLVVFYVLEHVARRSRSDSQRRDGEDCTPPGVFWVHMVSFSIYNGLIGYLLVDRVSEHESIPLYTLALGLHFLVTDDGLRRHHRDRYHDRGRWILAAVILGGAALGHLVPVHDVALHLLAAFLAGGIILNVLKEEVPAERESRIGAFTLGAAAYAALLLVVA